MRKILLSVIALLFLFSCTKEEIPEEKVNETFEGTYNGVFQRRYASEDSFISSVTMTFYSNEWSGSSGFGEDDNSYPGLCNGSYSINENTIKFNNSCHWSDNFIIQTYTLDGEFDLTESGEFIEFRRISEEGADPPYIDIYRLLKEDITEDQLPEESVFKTIDGTYNGVLQRKYSSNEVYLSNVSITFSNNRWTGSAEEGYFPLFCCGTYLIYGDTIFFSDENGWPAIYHSSDIFGGKFILTEVGNTIAFSSYADSKTPYFEDKYRFTKQE